MTIEANKYRATTRAVADAIAGSKRESGASVRVEASGHVFDAVKSELYDECSHVDDIGTALEFRGEDVDGVAWVVELVELDT